MPSVNGKRPVPVPSDPAGEKVKRMASTLGAENGRFLRPETLRLLHEMAATPAMAECPVSLSRDEVRAVLELIETRWVVSRAWARTLDWTLRYARIAQRLAERTGFPAYASWIERHRIRPMRRLHEELTQAAEVARPDTPATHIR